MEVLGIDVGGSGIKGAIVDTVSGELITDRIRLAAPSKFKPDDVIDLIAKLVKEFKYKGPMGVGFPAVVMHGTVMTPPTALAFPGWDEYPLAEALEKETKCPTVLLNDADAACLAEIEFGAGKNEPGVVMVFTFGTGIGSALFLDGHLVPNLELGRLFLGNTKKTAEDKASDRVRQAKKLSWKEWGKRLNEYFSYIELLFSPDMIIIGGGISKKHDKFLPYVKTRAKLVPADFRNEAGIVGAAMAAADPEQTALQPLKT